MISVNLEASNKEDWTIQFSATDEETGNDIIWTCADFAFKLRGYGACIDASTSAGNITLPDPTIVEIALTEDQMSTLCAGSYNIGCVYELNETKVQAFVGTASIYDGVASL